MNKKEQPLVSVIASFYNEGSNLLFEPSLMSILNQSYDCVEYIFVDDCSTDDTYNILLDLKRRSSRKIHLLRNQKNIDLASSLNRAIIKSRGKYVARFDAGDICIRSRFQKQVLYLEQHPDISILGSCALIVDDRSRRIRNWDVPLEFSAIKQQIFRNAIAIHPTIMMRRSDLLAFGVYDSRYRTEDYELYMRAVSRGYKLSNLGERTVKVLERKTGITHSKRFRMQYSRALVRIKYLRFMPTFLNLMYALRSCVGCAAIGAIVFYKRIFRIE